MRKTYFLNTSVVCGRILPQKFYVAAQKICNVGFYKAYELDPLRQLLRGLTGKLFSALGIFLFLKPFLWCITLIIWSIEFAKIEGEEFIVSYVKKIPNAIALIIKINKKKQKNLKIIYEYGIYKLTVFMAFLWREDPEQTY